MNTAVRDYLDDDLIQCYGLHAIITHTLQFKLMRKCLKINEHKKKIFKEL